jgi:periplasmic mercuric ion binding protein
MKSVKLFVAAVLLVFVSSALFAQGTTKTENIKVWGNCEMCKTRIEKAAKVDGVTKADWSDETKTLALVYNPAKVSIDDIQKKIAAVGHDTEKYKGDDKAYSKLPDCCKYDRKK